MVEPNANIWNGDSGENCEREKTLNKCDSSGRYVM